MNLSILVLGLIAALLGFAAIIGLVLFPKDKTELKRKSGKFEEK